MSERYGFDVVMVADDVDGELREPLHQALLVAGAHRLLHFGKDQNLRHGRAP